MIKDFWVKNFLSIRDKQEIDFTAKGAESELKVMMPDGTLLYKLGVLYGSNASGKSNMLVALNNVFRLLVWSKTNASESIEEYEPFKLTSEEPSEMHISFYANEILYDYDVKFNRQFILKEVLNYYPNGSKSLFYERTFVKENVQSDIKFGTSLKLLSKTQQSIRDNTLNNHSVLSVCRKNVFKEDIIQFTSLYEWIITHYHDVDDDFAQNQGIVEQLKEAYSDNKKHNFYRKMLQKADLNIFDFKPIKQDRIIPREFREQVQKDNLPGPIKDSLLKTVVDSIAFENHAGNESFEINLDNQSVGTIKYIQILEMLYDMISDNHIYYLDELGEDLHYDLLYYYLNVFIFNSQKSQLIITSQETSLLAQDLINENRGVVWFVEKNRETASSEYSRGDSFGLHKNLSLYNSYRIGRLGAKPELGSFFIDMEE